MRGVSWIRGCAVVCAGMLCVVSTVASAENPRNKKPSGWDVQLAPAGEPGDRFEMWGTVRDGKGDLLPGAKLFIYHADSSGSYGRFEQPLRLAATLLADEKGRYRIRSVFPGAYAGAPAHVHFEYLAPSLGAGFLNLRRQGKDRSTSGMNVPLDRDGVWRLNVNLTPGGRSAPPRDNFLGRAAADSAKWATPPGTPRDTTFAPR